VNLALAQIVVSASQLLHARQARPPQEGHTGLFRRPVQLRRVATLAR